MTIETKSPPMREGRADKRREDRRNAMIDAAESLFLELGYEQTTLSGIVQRSGGSLATLYEHFGNKQGLLRAAAGRWAEADKAPHPDLTNSADGRAGQLTTYALALYDHFTSSRAVAMKRIVQQEILRDPAFASSIYLELHLPAVEGLARIFSRMNDEGSARFDDSRAAAELFYSLVISDAQMRISCMGEEGRLTPQQIEWRLQPFLAYFDVK